MSFGGIHTGRSMGFEPTGQRVHWDGSALVTFRGEKVIDLWVLGDVKGLEERLGRNLAQQGRPRNPCRRVLDLQDPRRPGRMIWRLATAADIESLHAIYTHESVNPFMGFDVCSLEEFRTIFDDLRAAGDLLVFLEGDAVLGGINVVRRKRRLRHVAYLGSLAVRPDRSRQGIGRAIMATVLERLEAEGIRRVEILVASDNAGAIGFFESLGFEIEGTMRNYFSRGSSRKLYDEHVMALLYDGFPVNGQ